MSRWIVLGCRKESIVEEIRFSGARERSNSVNIVVFFVILHTNLVFKFALEV